MMSFGGSIANRLTAILWLAGAVGILGGCVSQTAPRQVYVHWQALMVYHPLWGASWREMPRPQQSVTASLLPSRLALGETTLQPGDSPYSEARRQRILQSSQQQQQQMFARLQQLESRRLQEELEQLQQQRDADIQKAQQEIGQQAEQIVQALLEQYRYPQAEDEIRRQVIQQMVRLRPDLRDALTPRLHQLEQKQAARYNLLQQHLQEQARATEQTLREHTAALEDAYNLQRAEIMRQSEQRLQREQLRVVLQLQAFAHLPKTNILPEVVISLPAERITPRREAARATPEVGASLLPLIERDTRKWVEAICRRHRWSPVWSPQAGIPDVTAQIAQEMAQERR